MGGRPLASSLYEGESFFDPIVEEKEERGWSWTSFCAEPPLSPLEMKTTREERVARKGGGLSPSREKAM